MTKIGTKYPWSKGNNISRATPFCKLGYYMMKRVHFFQMKDHWSSDSREIAAKYEKFIDCIYFFVLEYRANQLNLALIVFVWRGYSIIGTHSLESVVGSNNEGFHFFFFLHKKYDQSMLIKEIKIQMMWYYNHSFIKASLLTEPFIRLAMWPLGILLYIW